jgi:hypothetical protein
MENTVRNHLWIWGHEAGSHNEMWNMPGKSRMTPFEGAYYLGVPNVIMVVFRNQPEPPFNRLAIAFRPLQQVVWSILGDGSSIRNDQHTDLEEVLKLSHQFSNLTGAIMDDFFHEPDANGAISRLSISDLKRIHAQLHSGSHHLNLWAVAYTQNLDIPVKDYLDACDGVTFWTWKPEHLLDLEHNFSRLEALIPDKRKMLGIYLWDYDQGQAMPLELLKNQCTTGLQWLREGRVEGLIFLASCICDLELESVEWARQWIAEVGEEKLG